MQVGFMGCHSSIAFAKAYHRHLNIKKSFSFERLFYVDKI
ncbi:hypothetical protein JCM19297_1459 [Nonlabens ulvanivorans]|nr:hypothetical protein JCM19297_1459 [Nonlabens ulvanivorans]